MTFTNISLVVLQPLGQAAWHFTETEIVSPQAPSPSEGLQVLPAPPPASTSPA